MQKPTTLSDLPPHINQRIVDLACTNDSMTRRALGRVSRFVSKMANMFTWRSISVSGIKDLRSLASRLERDPIKGKSVQNLFLSDRLEIHSGKRRYAKDWKKEAEEARIADEEEAKEIVKVMERIVPFLAGTLRRACILCFNGYSNNAVFSTFFSAGLPNLIHLTTWGQFDHSLPLQPLPRLERLFLATHDTAGYLPRVASQFPALTHLRIWTTDMTVVRYLQKAYDQPLSPSYYSSTSEEEMTGELPPTLRYIFLDQPDYAMGFWCGASNATYEQILAGVKNLAQAVPDVIVCSPDLGKARYSYKEAWIAWKNEIYGGGDGFWPKIKKEASDSGAQYRELDTEGTTERPVS
jgi:hypothetical protein